MQLPTPAQWGSIIIGLGIPVFLWLFFKPYFVAALQVKPLTQQLNHFKHNKPLFQKLLAAEIKQELLADEDLLILSDNAAKYTLTLVSDPYCVHCASVHSEIDKWLVTRPDIKLQVIIYTGNDANKKQVARHLMAIKLNTGDALAKKALDAWYKPKLPSFGIWSRKYPANETPAAATAAVAKQRVWCSQAKITSTPALFINGNKVDDVYTVEDMRHFV
jgi:protein-disulfide isomerase